jgi:hypothetical protein
MKFITEFRKQGEGMRRWHKIYYRVQKTELRSDKMTYKLLQSPENRAKIREDSRKFITESRKQG